MRENRITFEAQDECILVELHGDLLDDRKWELAAKDAREILNADDHVVVWQHPNTWMSNPGILIDELRSIGCEVEPHECDEILTGLIYPNREPVYYTAPLRRPV